MTVEPNSSKEISVSGPWLGEHARRADSHWSLAVDAVPLGLSSELSAMTMAEFVSFTLGHRPPCCPESSPRRASQGTARSC